MLVTYCYYFSFFPLCHFWLLFSLFLNSSLSFISAAHFHNYLWLLLMHGHHSSSPHEKQRAAYPVAVCPRVHTESYWNTPRMLTLPSLMGQLMFPWIKGMASRASWGYSMHGVGMCGEECTIFWWLSVPTLLSHQLFAVNISILWLSLTR